jgi:RNA ligase
MAHLSDLLDVDQLEIELQDGYVRERRHPFADLTIFNYTEKAQYERRWNDITTQCRGLIVDTPSGRVVGRPWAKFFNYGEHPEGGLSLHKAVEVTDKMDGSLGILYHDGEDFAIATRGSFTSDQAQVGTQILREQYLPRWKPNPALTYLFEVIFPENRIVLDYGDVRDLVLLGAVHIDTGVVFGPNVDNYEETDLRRFGDREPVTTITTGWPGPRTEILPASTLAEALELPNRENAEGLVVRYLDGSDTMVKIKQEDYVTLHKLVTGLNERAVWEHLSANGGELEGLLAQVPDEFHTWVREVGGNLLDAHTNLVGIAHAAYDAVRAELDEVTGSEDWSRKDFALRARELESLTPFLFQLLDGRDISPSVWKLLRPVGESQSLMNRTEDVA